MRRMTFYRLCLLMPLLMPLPLVLGVDRETLRADSFLYTLHGMGEWILRLGGVPYALLATLLYVRSFRWTTREMRQKLVRSPFWMIPFQWIFTVGFFLSTDWNSLRLGLVGGFELLRFLGAAIFMVIPVGIVTLLVGYFFVLVATGLEQMQERHGVMPPHDDTLRPLCSRMTYYRFWLTVPVLVSALVVAALRQRLSDNDFAGIVPLLLAYGVFGIVPYLAVAAQYYSESLSQTAQAMYESLSKAPHRMLPWVGGIIFVCSLPTFGLMFVIGFPVAALAVYTLGYTFYGIACALETFMDRFGMLAADTEMKGV
jgi:hypothetical protein